MTVFKIFGYQIGECRAAEAFGNGSDFAEKGFHSSLRFIRNEKLTLMLFLEFEVIFSFNTRIFHIFEG